MKIGMKFGLAFVAEFSFAVMQPNNASASTYILDTGTPNGGKTNPQTLYPSLTLDFSGNIQKPERQ
jgi:hypothetical protein